MVFADIKYSAIMSKKSNKRKNAVSKEHQVAVALGFIEMVLICLHEKKIKETGVNHN